MRVRAIVRMCVGAARFVLAWSVRNIIGAMVTNESMLRRHDWWKHMMMAPNSEIVDCKER